MSADLMFQSALLLFQQGRLEQARDLCSQLVTRHPRHAQGMHLLGAVLLRLGQWDAGFQSVRAAIVADPSEPAAYLTLGNALMQQRRAGEAVSCYAMAARLRPDDADVLNSHAAALRDAGQPQAALSCLDDALSLQPGLARAHNNRGNALRDLGRNDEAVAAYQRAMALDPQNALARDNLQRLLNATGRPSAGVHSNMLTLGDARLAAGQPQEALHYYDQHLRAYPDHIEALNHRGAALLALKRREEAAVAFDRLIELDPGNASAHNNMGACHEVDHPELALDCFTRACELAADNPTYWFHRAQGLDADRPP